MLDIQTLPSRYEIDSCLRTFYEGYSHFILKTPLWRLPGKALGVDCAEVWLKLEHLQTGGSFKARGMLQRLLSHPVQPAGVTVASGGNAGIATAAAAQTLGVACTVFVPALCPPAKRARLLALGAEVVVGGENYAEALAACLAHQQRTGALLAHAYDQREVLMGAGTLALEIAQQADNLPDSVLVSVGGGGLMGGMVCAFEGQSRIVALEPARAPTLHAAMAAGQPVDVEVGGIAADSLGARRIGSLAWQAVQKHPVESLLLTDEAIRAAQVWLWKNYKLAVEPAAALPLAALQTGAYVPAADEKVCLIVCGANIDPATLN